MDYSYYNNAPQAYQFLGLPPTPGHTAGSGTGSTHSDEFSASPPVRSQFHYMPSSHQSHPSSQAQAQSQRPALLIPSHHLQTPLHSHSQHLHSPIQHSPLQHSPLQHSPHLSQHSPHLQAHLPRSFLTPSPTQDAFDQYQNFDAYNQHFTAAAAVPKPPTPLSQNASIGGNHVAAYDMGNGVEASEEGLRRGQSNSDDDDMTPAQSRRKAQNRAAQRAFRERKERHVKDLETKLANMEKATLSISEENQRLKLQLQKASTENEILKATTSSSHSRSPEISTSGPMRYSPTDFYTEVFHAHENKTPSHRIVLSDNGEKLLAAGAAWDYIIKHPLFMRGMVDVGDVSERLKGVARCDGQGPVFEERAIVEAIERSVASGSDELL